MNWSFKYFTLILSLVLTTRGEAQLTSFGVLNPISRLETMPAFGNSPKFYLEVGGVGLNLATNFNFGQILGGDVGSNLMQLARANDLINLNGDVVVRPIGILRSKSSFVETLGIEVIQSNTLSIDSDFLQLITEGITLNPLGQYAISNSGVYVSSILKERLFYGRHSKSENLSISFRINFDAPLAGFRFVTDECQLNREFSADTNFIAFKYRARAQYFGREIIDGILQNEFSLGSLRPNKFTPSLNFGVERKLSSKLSVGLGVSNFTLIPAINDIYEITYEGGYDFEGVNYQLGVDSMTAIFEDVSSLDVTSILPTITEGSGNWNLSGNVDLILYARVRRGNNKEMLWFVQRKKDYLMTRTFSGVFLEDTDSKWFHVNYGFTYLLEYGILNPSLSFRALISPWTRLSVGINNPLNIPRFSGGTPYVYSGSNGLNVNVGLSFGTFKQE